MATLTLQAAHDAYTSSSSPGNNYGALASMSVANDTAFQAWLRFDLSTLPAGATVSSALLRLNKTDSDPVATVSIRRITATWDESTITHNTRPAVDSTVRASASVGEVGWYEFDITTLLNEWVAGTNPNHGVNVRQPSASDFTFAASEHGTSSIRPELVITYTVPSAPTQPGAFTAPVADQVVDASLDYAHGASTDPDGDFAYYQLQRTLNGGGSWTALNNRTSPSGTIPTSTWTPTSTARLRVRAVDSGGRTSDWRESPMFTISHYTAPTAATNLLPASGQTINRLQTNTVTWETPSAQTAYDWRYRLVGDTSWTTVNATSTSKQHQIAAGLLAAGDYEHQVRWYDSIGEAAPWSASSFFTAAEVSAPTIDDPLDGAIIGTATRQVAWTITNQAEWEVRRVADDAGNPDTATVYQTKSGISTTQRNVLMDFPVEGRFEHIQVRVKYGGLWSAWTSIRVSVDYQPPATADVTLTETAEHWVGIAIINPAAVDPEPAATSNDIYRREVGSGDPDGTLIASGLAAGTATFTDVMVAHRTDYEYRVVSHAANDTSVTTDWIGGVDPDADIDFYAGGY